MTDDLSQFLRTGAGRAALSPEKLELMGKEAATHLIEKNIPLEESVVKLASQHPDMNSEQVRRVVEFANTEAYLSFHQKNKTAGAESSYPQFSLADPESVLAKLAGGRPDPVPQDASYSQMPEARSVSNAKREAALEELFLGPNHERVKLSAAHITGESAAHNMLSAKSDLQDLKNNLEHSGERIQMLRKQAEADYYHAVKIHLLDGGSVIDVLRGALESGLSGDKIASVLTPFLSKLQEERVVSKSAFAKEAMSLEGVRHRVVDSRHPFVAGFAALVELTGEEDKTAAALDDVGAQLSKVQDAIKEGFLR